MRVLDGLAQKAREMRGQGDVAGAEQVEALVSAARANRAERLALVRAWRMSKQGEAAANRPEQALLSRREPGAFRNVSLREWMLSAPSGKGG